MANFVKREDGYLLYANSQDNRGIVQKWMDICTNHKGKFMSLRIHPLEKKVTIISDILIRMVMKYW